MLSLSKIAALAAVTFTVSVVEGYSPVPKNHQLDPTSITKMPTKRIVVKKFVPTKDPATTVADTKVSAIGKMASFVNGSQKVHQLFLTAIISIELALHACSFSFVHEITKMVNIYFDTMLFSYLSWKKRGRKDHKFYTFFAIEHIVFLFMKFTVPSLYLQIFETKSKIPGLYYTATLVECAAYIKVLVEFVMSAIVRSFLGRGIRNALKTPLAGNSIANAWSIQ